MSVKRAGAMAARRQQQKHTRIHTLGVGKQKFLYSRELCRIPDSPPLPRNGITTNQICTSGTGIDSMQQLDLDNARAGMVLGEDAVNAKGQLLLRAGTVLSDRHLQMLHANAVARIGVGEPDTAPAAPGLGTDIETHIEERFRFCDSQHPLVSELRRICRQRLNEAQGGSDDD
jgi:hypothetical protein